MTAPMHCPHCEHELSPAFTSRLAERSVVRLVLHPEPANLLHARTVAGTIRSLAGLLEASGRDAGVPVQAFISDLSVGADGTVEIAVLVAVDLDQRPTKEDKADGE